MALTLNAQTEQRIQREIDLGHYREPAEVINRALDLLQAEQAWSEEEKAELDAHLTESMAPNCARRRHPRRPGPRPTRRTPRRRTSA